MKHLEYVYKNQVCQFLLPVWLVVSNLLILGFAPENPTAGNHTLNSIAINYCKTNYSATCTKEVF